MKDFKELTGRDIPYNSEVIDRETLHANGCDILLTNFKMLEYALVRREDAALFETSCEGRPPAVPGAGRDAQLFGSSRRRHGATCA